MTRDPISGVRILDRTVDYTDGSEDRLLEILAAAEDTSSLSDELAAKIEDWPTRYHLARERSNLLRPFSIDGRHRLLEIGAGTGVISRYLGETGAQVVALEGSLARARAAAVRCRDLDNVEVVCGAAESFDAPEGFDLVFLIGVLEYAGSGENATGPETFLRTAAGHLRPGGSLVVAIENQLGLKYLLGYEEDHFGRPWVGVEAYRDSRGVRTFSRRRLAQLIEGAGLENQSWFYPFPDYKLPTTVVRHSAYGEPDATALIDQLVGSPVGGHENAPDLVCDQRRAHRVMLEAGLGPEVANSFLVLASAGPPGRGVEPEQGTLAWLYGKPRLRRWLRHQVVEGDGTGRRIRTIGPTGSTEDRAADWLRQNPAKDEAFVTGTTVWQHAVEAAERRDTTALERILRSWRRTVDRSRSVLPTHGAVHPFLAPSTTEVLPPDHLDICTSNFVVAGPECRFIDREWVAEPAVDADLVIVRALWLLAHHLASSGVTHPWSPSLTVDELTIELARLVELDAEELLDRLYEAEAELQHLVTGRDRNAIADGFAWLRGSRPTDPGIVGAIPINRLRERVDVMHDEIARLGEEHGRELAERARLETEVADERDTVDRLTHELVDAHELLTEVGGKLESTAAALEKAQRENESLQRRSADLEALEARFAELQTEADGLRSWREAFEQRLPVRIWRRFRGPKS